MKFSPLCRTKWSWTDTLKPGPKSSILKLCHGQFGDRDKKSKLVESYHLLVFRGPGENSIRSREMFSCVFCFLHFYLMTPSFSYSLLPLVQKDTLFLHTAFLSGRCWLFIIDHQYSYLFCTILSVLLFCKKVWATFPILCFITSIRFLCIYFRHHINDFPLTFRSFSSYLTIHSYIVHSCFRNEVSKNIDFCKYLYAVVWKYIHKFPLKDGE